MGGLVVAWRLCALVYILALLFELLQWWSERCDVPLHRCDGGFRIGRLGKDPNLSWRRVSNSIACVAQGGRANVLCATEAWSGRAGAAGWSGEQTAQG